MLLEPDVGRRGHDGHAVPLNRGMLWAVGGSSSLLGGPTFSLNMPTAIISAISTKVPLNNNSSKVGGYLGRHLHYCSQDFALLDGVWTWVIKIYLKQRKGF